MNVYLQILGMGFTSAIIGSLLTWGISTFVKYRERITMANYSAIRLSIDLDRFAFTCAEEINDTGMENARYGQPILCAVPELEFTSTIQWDSLDISIVRRALSIQNDHPKATSYIKSMWATCNDPDEAVDESIDQLAVLGYRAHDIAEDIRKKYPQSAGTPDIYPWDHIATIRPIHNKAVARYAERRAWRSRASNDLPGEIPAPPAPPPPHPLFPESAT